MITSWCRPTLRDAVSPHSSAASAASLQPSHCSALTCVAVPSLSQSAARSPRVPCTQPAVHGLDAQASRHTLLSHVACYVNTRHAGCQVRVVQKEEYEDSNMVRVTWIWSWESVTHQVELRHGRRSGIRKIYVDRQLLERQKSVKNMVSDAGSQHEFMVGNRRAEVSIVPKGSSGFLYQLKVDGQAIEQNMVRAALVRMALVRMALMREYSPSAYSPSAYSP